MAKRIAACRGAIDGLRGEVVEDQVRFHVIERHQHRGADPVEVGEELIEVIRRYLRQVSAPEIVIGSNIEVCRARE
jgi:DNA-binding FrmR family transcriptional regulator